MRDLFVTLLNQAKRPTQRFNRKKTTLDLPIDFFKTLFSIIQYEDAPYIKKIGVGRTGQPTYEFDVQAYAHTVKSEWQAVISGLLDNHQISKQVLKQIYYEINSYAKHLIDQLELFSERFYGSFNALQSSLFDDLLTFFASRYPGYRSWPLEKDAPSRFDLNLLVLSTAQAYTMRITEFLGYMLDAIEDCLGQVSLARQQVKHPPGVNSLGFRDFMADKLDETVEQHERYLPAPISELRHSGAERPWRSQIAQPGVPSTVAVPHRNLSLIEKWRLLPTRQKWMMAGLLLFEAAIVVALAVVVPGSEVVTVPAASALAANVLASMLGTIVLTCTAAGCAYHVFQQHVDSKSDIGHHHELVTASRV